MSTKFTIFAVLAAAVTFSSAGLLMPSVSAQLTSTKAGPSNSVPVPTPTPEPAATVSPTPKPSFDDPNEIIKVDTELVNLNVRVIDRNSRPINDIQQKDFKIYEDGVQQTIDFFSKSEVPTTYSIVVDNSGSMRPQLEKVIEAGKILVNTNKPEDKTSIIRFVGKEKISIEQDLTTNKSDLTDALDDLYIEGGQTAIIDAVYLATENLEADAKSKVSDDRGRRAIVLVTDGEDRDSYYNIKQLMDLLRESDVQIYVVGLVSDLSSEGGLITKSPQGKAKAFLEQLASETGGKAYFPKGVDELPQIGRDIASELRTQYSIGYIPSNEAHDGTFRNIKITVDDGPNKQKRIAVSRNGRTAEGGSPKLQKSSQTPVKP
ncbi:MAG: VWA domain-containing protein [Acidobacteriota bacterium]